MKPIVNRVSKSPLITLDLEDFYPIGKRLVFDIAPWLEGGQILIEKQFREAAESHSWPNYKDAFVAIKCSADAIIPSWAYLLVSAYLAPYAKCIVVGDLNLLETVIFTEIINNLDINQFNNKPIIIKGCSNKPIPDTAFTALVKKLKPVVKNIMYGEACSTVPIFKNKS
jgi:uncharacterized protein DUF2480